MAFPAPAPTSYLTHESAQRSWRRRAIVVAAIAAIELIVLVVIALAFIAKPFADDASSPRKAQAKTGAPAAQRALPRAKTRVLVLNGNGIAGAASATARAVHRLDYPVVGVADASRQDFSRTVVMYRADERVAAVRLAKDLGLGVRRVMPLDGIRPSDLHGAQVALILGRSS